METPDKKLRRDREFLQRNDDFFKLLLKIQKLCQIIPLDQYPVSPNELYRSSTKLRLERSDHFAQVFLDIMAEKGPIYMENYGSDNDIRVSPFKECICDYEVAHRLTGIVLLPQFENKERKVCVGLCFESDSVSLKACILQLSLIGKEIDKNVSDIQIELTKGNDECQKDLKDMRSNLISLFSDIHAELKSAFITLEPSSPLVMAIQSGQTGSNIQDRNFTRAIMEEIWKIKEELLDLNECATVYNVQKC